MNHNKIYLVTITILLCCCIFEAGIITGLPKIVYDTITETKTKTKEVNPDAVWVVEFIDNDTLYADVFQYNESYDVYFRLDEGYDMTFTWYNGHYDALITFCQFDKSNPYSVWGEVIDSVQIHTPNYYNIGKDGFYFESMRYMGFD